MMKITTTLRRSLLAVLVASGTLTAVTTSAEAMNCVQFMQHASQVSLHGDAYTWWDNANGQYGRGGRPQPGAVMVFSKTGNLQHGHVAMVRSVRDNRTVLVDHANWSPIRGHRGQVERAVAIVDVSPHNDWSRVRVWYNPTAEIGQTVYPVKGFVYPKHPTTGHHVR
jgi:hypothetical protein